MQIDSGADILEQARDDFRSIGRDLSWTDFVTEVQRILAKWMSFLEEVRSAENEILELARSTTSVLRHVAPEMAEEWDFIPSSSIADTTRRGPSTTRSTRIREVAHVELERVHKWLSTTTLVAAARRSDSWIDGISSSRVSAALRYGGQRGEFAMRMKDGKKEWGLPDWEQSELESGESPQKESV